jgi:ABC-2 type transport system permease protein
MIELYLNPTRPTGSGVIKAIVDQFISQVETGRIGSQIAISRMIQSGLIAPQDAIRLGMQLGRSQAQAAASSQWILLNSIVEGSAPQDFNVMAYMAPGMALMFLMFTVTYGGQRLLVEKIHGTLPRLLTAPVSSGQVLLGKMFGVFLTGCLQMLILILASTLLFRIDWGNPLPVLLLVMTAVAGAVGWGMIITALAKTPGQAGTIGMALMLTFGILGGSFFDISILPSWFQFASKITPNAWGLDGFTRLARGGGLPDILPSIGGLLGMGVILFGISLLLFKRRGIIQQ